MAAPEGLKEIKIHLSPKVHEKFKTKCGNRKMKDRVRDLIAADAAGLITITKANKK